MRDEFKEELRELFWISGTAIRVTLLAPALRAAFVILAFFAIVAITALIPLAVLAALVLKLAVFFQERKLRRLLGDCRRRVLAGERRLGALKRLIASRSQCGTKNEAATWVS